MTKDEQKLYNELIKDIRKANARIRSLEKYSGEKESFDVKELVDFLSVEGLNALTKKGRISTSKDFTLFQMKMIDKVVKNFLDGVSTVKKAESFRKQLSQDFGVPLSIEYTTAFYRFVKNYDWIYDYIDPSEFWSEFAPKALVMDFESWADYVMTYAVNIVKEPDLMTKLNSLYYYVQKGSK